MQGVTYDGKHTYWDWGLLLREHPVVSPPVPKTKLVEVPGSDGHIDLSEVLTGQIHYEMREITCKFTMMAARDRWPSLYSEILNFLHGKRMKITLDNEQDFYYTGRVEISEWNPGQTVAELTIKATVSPFKTSCFDGRQVL